MFDAARVHDDGAGHDRDPPAGLAHVAHHLRNPRHAAFDAPLRRDVVAHEGEAMPVALAELRRHADALVTADHRLAGLDIAELAAFSAIARRDDHRVHALLVDFDPPPA